MVNKYKSPRYIMLGTMKKTNLKKSVKRIKDNISSIECPRCGECHCNRIIRLRANFFECEGCGYKGDIDEWYIRKNTYKGKKLNKLSSNIDS